MIEKSKIENIVSEALMGSEIFPVEVSVSRSNLIQVVIDSPAGIGLDDCATLHRALEGKLDRDQEDYELQVSSPGLGQPLRVFKQYLKAVGQRMEVLLTSGETVRGTLVEASPDELIISPAGTKRKPAPDGPVSIRMEEVKIARVEIDFKQM